MRWLAMVMAAVWVGTLLTGLARAGDQQASGWVGQRVIMKQGTVLRGGGQVEDKEGRGRGTVSGRARLVLRVYQVRQVNGHWLWLAAENDGVEGWAKVQDVIPYDQAIDYLTREIRTRPSPELYVHRGSVWETRGEHDLAIADFNEAIRLDPKLASAYVARGALWSDKKDEDRAIADCTEAIRLDPRDASVHNNRAWLLATCPDATYRDGKTALEDASRAYQIVGENSADVQDTLAAAYAETGDFDSAVKCQEKGLSLLPKDDEAARKVFSEHLELYRAKKPYREQPAVR